MSISTIVGYVQNYGKKEMWNWAMSIKQHYTGDVVVIASDITQETYDWLKGLGFTVYVHPPAPTAAVVTRFLYLWKLIELRKIESDWIMMSDVKDVIFQDDLETWLTTKLEDLRYQDFASNWIAGGENVRYEDEPWGRENLQMSFPHAYDSLARREILNAGTFCAKRRTMKDICMLVYLMSVNNKVYNPDQAALNIVLGAMTMEGVEADIEESYAIQIGTTFDPRKKLKQITETEGITWGSDGIVKTVGERPYVIVHQYDRNPELKALIDKRFAE